MYYTLCIFNCQFAHLIVNNNQYPLAPPPPPPPPEEPPPLLPELQLEDPDDEDDEDDEDDDELKEDKNDLDRETDLLRSVYTFDAKKPVRVSTELSLSLYH